MKLKIVTPEEKKRNLEKRANKMWIVNVLSTPNTKEIIPATMKLLKEGYLAYITRTKVKGKDYMRLRIGFFGTRTEADAAGKKIKALLNLGDPWKTKAGKEEFKEFAGY
jgi:cell division septation protein DedD